MNILRKFLSSISHFLLSIIRVLRKTLCCRRKKDNDYILPLTVDQINESLSHKSSDMYEYHSQWGAWPETGNSSSVAASNLNTGTNVESQNFMQEESPDDYFKDMVPQIRKPKKIYVRKEVEEREECAASNRLAMDPKAILSDPDLGIIDDGPSNWEDGENSDPNQLIRETKRVEREIRLAEHQRRKQERENRRASKQDSSSSIAILNLSDSRDKAKSS